MLAERDIELSTPEGGPLRWPRRSAAVGAGPGWPGGTHRRRGVVVAITTEITPELRDRGIARELVRAIGELRKKAGCKVSEQVRIGYVTSDAIVAAALSQHRAFVEGETLSQLNAEALPQPHGQSTVDPMTARSSSRYFEGKGVPAGGAGRLQEMWRLRWRCTGRPRQAQIDDQVRTACLVLSGVDRRAVALPGRQGGIVQAMPTEQGDALVGVQALDDRGDILGIAAA